MLKNKWIVVSVVFMVIALLDAIYLTQHHYSVNVVQPDTKSFCSINAAIDCDKVAQSSYSMMFGVPVSSIGIFAYSFLLILMISAFWWKAGTYLAGTLAFIYPVAWLMILFSLYEFAASVFVIKSVCLMCMLLYISVIAMTCSIKAALAKNHLVIAHEAKSFFVNLFNFKVHGGFSVIFLGIFVFSVLFAIFSDRYFEGVAYQKLEAKEQIEKAERRSKREAEDRDRMLTAYYLLPEEKLDQSGAPMKGELGAPITVIEFSDFQCPFCKMMGGHLQQLVQEFAGKVRLFFMHYPLDNKCNPAIQGAFHQEACDLHKAAYCAQMQGKFWEVHDYFFSMNGDHAENVLETFLAENTLGIDKKVMQNCLAKDDWGNVGKDIKLANKLGVSYTPTIYINGRKSSEVAKSFEEMKFIVTSLIEDLEKKK